MGDQESSTTTLTPRTAPRSGGAPFNASLVFRDSVRRKLGGPLPWDAPGHKTASISPCHYIYPLYIVSKTIYVYLRAGLYLHASWLENTGSGQKEQQTRFRASHRELQRSLLSDSMGLRGLQCSEAQSPRSCRRSPQFTQAPERACIVLILGLGVCEGYERNDIRNLAFLVSDGG
jgi:hypothetical protein